MIRIILFAFFALAFIQLVNSQDTTACTNAATELNNGSCDADNTGEFCSGTCRTLIENYIDACEDIVRF